MNLALEDLEASIKGQQVKLSALAKRHEELYEETAALRDCLKEIGILSEDAVSVRIHQRRFATAIAQHPLRGSCASLEAVMRTCELAQAIALPAGAECIPLVSAACSALSRAVSAAAPKLSELFPPSVYVVGGSGDGQVGPLHTVDCLDLVSNVWSPIAPLPTPRAMCSSVAAGGRLYTIAGRDGDGRVLRTVASLNVRSNVWRHEPDLLRASGWVAATAFRGSVCVLGGDLPELVLDVAERFDVCSRVWGPLPPMSNPRWAAAAVACGGNLWALAGHGEDHQVLRACERWCPGNWSWEALPPLHEARAALSATAAGNRVYVVGGYDDSEVALPSLESFDCRRHAWELLAPMGVARWGLGAVATYCVADDGKVQLGVYVFGGTNGHGGTNAGAVRCFDAESGSWRQLPGHAQNPRRCFGIAVCR